MTDLVLRDIAPDMAARIRRLAEAQGCTSHDVIVEVLDAGVRACEDALRKRLDLEEQAYNTAVAFGQQQADLSGLSKDSAEYARLIKVLTHEYRGLKGMKC